MTSWRPTGPLFNFDVHDDVRLLSDATVEKDEVRCGAGGQGCVGLGLSMCGAGGDMDVWGWGSWMCGAGRHGCVGRPTYLWGRDPLVYGAETHRSMGPRPTYLWGCDPHIYGAVTHRSMGPRPTYLWGQGPHIYGAETHISMGLRPTDLWG